MSRLSVHEFLQYLKEKPFLMIRIVILIISFAFLITAIGYVSAYTPEVYIRGVPFMKDSCVMRARRHLPQLPLFFLQNIQKAKITLEKSLPIVRNNHL